MSDINQDNFNDNIENLDIFEHHKHLLIAIVDMLERTGSVNFMLRYCDEDKPTVWMALAEYDGEHIAAGEKFQVAAAMHPIQAAFRLLESLVDGGRCTHCDRTTGVTLTTNDNSNLPKPIDSLVCWFVYDEQQQSFIRDCIDRYPSHPDHPDHPSNQPHDAA
jgi:hypothetical protein